MRLILIRHGMTEGNKTKKYVGRTDEPLSQEGKEIIEQRVKERKYPTIDRLVVSPMKRCRETAALIYPNWEAKVVEGFRECDFGLFEYKNYMELESNPSYQKWIDSNGTLPFPEGESQASFQERCVVAFHEWLDSVTEDEEKTTAIVVHGGTIMSIMSALCKEREHYFQWMVQNGCGFICDYDKDLGKIQILEELDFGN